MKSENERVTPSQNQPSRQKDQKQNRQEQNPDGRFEKTARKEQHQQNR